MSEEKEEKKLKSNKKTSNLPERKEMIEVSRIVELMDGRRNLGG